MKGTKENPGREILDLAEENFSATEKKVAILSRYQGKSVAVL